MTENILLRLTFYPAITALLLLAAWVYINPELVGVGVGAFCVTLLFIMAADYYSGFVYSGEKFSLMFLLFVKMGFMFALVLLKLNIGWYLLIATVLLGFCVFARKRAMRIFLTSNLSVRPA